MKWNVGTKIGAGFGLALAIFVIVGAVSYRSTTELIEASDLRKHTYDVLSQLDETLSLLKDAEIGQRGYLLTGEESYLEPYQTALGKIDKSLQEVRKLTADNPRQQQRLDALEPLVKNRLAFAKETIDARRAAKGQEAVQLIKTGKGKALTDEIRKVMGEMRSEEEALLKQRVEAAQNDAQNAKRTIVLGTLTALVLAALAGFILTRNIARPLQDLTAVAERITVGDLSVNVSVDTRSDEVGVLARTFDPPFFFRPGPGPPAGGRPSGASLPPPPLSPRRLFGPPLRACPRICASRLAGWSKARMCWARRPARSSRRPRNWRPAPASPPPP